MARSPAAERSQHAAAVTTRRSPRKRASCEESYHRSASSSSSSPLSNKKTKEAHRRDDAAAELAGSSNTAKSSSDRRLEAEGGRGDGDGSFAERRSRGSDTDDGDDEAEDVTIEELMRRDEEGEERVDDGRDDSEEDTIEELKRRKEERKAGGNDGGKRTEEVEVIEPGQEEDDGEGGGGEEAGDDDPPVPQKTPRGRGRGKASEATFLERVAALRAHKEKFGHLRVSIKDDKQLYHFIQNVRQSRRRIEIGKSGVMAMTDDRIAALDSIGFEWKTRRRSSSGGGPSGGEARGEHPSAEGGKTPSPVDSDPGDAYKLGNAPFGSNIEEAGDMTKNGLGGQGRPRSEPVIGQSAKNQRVTPNDVFIGQTLGRELCQDNVKYQELLESNRACYQALNGRGEKALLVRRIIREVKSLDPPGRFLRFDSYGYHEVEDEIVRKKISQILGKGTRGKYNKKQQKGDSGESNTSVVSLSKENKLETESAIAAVNMIIENEGIGNLEKGSRGKYNEKHQKRDSNESNTSVVSLGDENPPPGDVNEAAVGATVNMIIENEGIGDQKSFRAASKLSPADGIVRPHDSDSAYNDVLSYFASTPFDSESMRSLREQKEKRGILTTVAREGSAILPSRACLPIVSQKQFMNTKVPPPAPAAGEDDGTGIRDCDGARSSSKPSHAVEKEVSKFLLEEARHLADAAVPATQRNRIQPASGPVLLTNGNGAQSSVRNASLPRIFTDGSLHKSHAGPTVVVAGKKIKATDTNVKAMAGMPIAFGFSLNDNGASKHLARAAAEKWTAEGTKATKPMGTNLHVSLDDGKNSSSAACIAPKTPMTPSCGSISGTPKTPRTPAVLLSTNPAPKNLPDGWIARTFRRESGKTAGTKDTYFYSPQKSIKFRAMKGCKLFLGILDEPGMDGNESLALKVFKERGHRC